MEDLAMRLAYADLEFAQQISKQGLLGQTTTCCATGTRSREVSWGLKYPAIVKEADEMDPAALRREVGALLID
jgi:hypothetical protein